MEIQTEEFPTCIAVSNDSKFVLGSVDGSLRLAHFNIEDEVVEFGWQFNMKAPVRKVVFNHDGTQILTVSRNKAVCSYDVETGTRTRCVVEGTSGLPTSICLIPPTAPKHQFATGCENAEVCTWDFRASEPRICKWKEQYEDINALAMDSRHNLLSASADGTLAAFDMRKRKLRVRSEVMASELLSICVSDKYTYVGGSDGHLEVFNIGEYGNILGRIESGFDMGVSDIVQLRRGLLLTSSESSNCLRLLNVEPNKKLGIMRQHGDADVGIDTIAASPDRKTLISMSSMSSSLMLWSLRDILAKIPVLRADKIEKRKQPTKEEFFDDLIASHKKSRVDDSDEEDSDEDEEEGEDEEESDEETTAATGKQSAAVAESDENEDEEIDEELEDEDEEEGEGEEVAVKGKQAEVAEEESDEDEEEDEEEFEEEVEPVKPPPKAKVFPNAAKYAKKGAAAVIKGMPTTQFKKRK